MREKIPNVRECVSANKVLNSIVLFIALTTKLRQITSTLDFCWLLLANTAGCVSRESKYVFCHCCGNASVFRIGRVIASGR